ncbi:protein iolH, partial [Pokkaliibacter plantistimulans]
YIAPHSFYYGDDLAESIRATQGLLAHARIADTFNHKASSQLRYIVNPPGSTARVHQHLNIGEGEIDWDVFFRTLHECGFDGVLSSCVFAWEEQAEASGRFMRQAIQRHVDRYWG